VRLASYNVENLFLRAAALDAGDPAATRRALQAHAELNFILQKERYTAADKSKIIRLIKRLGLQRSDEGSAYALLRQNRGQLLKRSKSGVHVVASGRADWIGWVELKIKEVNETATRMTARVIKDLKADVLAIIEAESRPALLRFSERVLKDEGAKPFAHIMLIDGNDERGIDVGLMTTPKYEIASVRSHVDDKDSSGLIFSRDCAEYAVRTPAGNELLVLVNHLKSKGFGSPASSDAKRRRQALRVRKIYERLRQQGYELIAVVGDLNDTPDSKPLAPLLRTDLQDITAHGSFNSDGHPGTYKEGRSGDKIDYVLLSPALFERTRAGGIYRKGVWANRRGDRFTHYDEITQESQAASDHAAIWADIDV
jgi:endonuclease/exonuclease/phosphatase family metal-dependent hydrolase